MSSPSAQPSSSTRQVYRVLVLRPVVTVSLLLGGLVVFEWIAIRDLTVTLIAAGSFAAIIGSATALVYFGAYLSTSEAGITYRNYGFKVVSSWDNVVGIGTRISNGQTYDCLLLRKGGLEASTWLRVGLAMRPVANLDHELTGQGGWARRVDLDAENYSIPVGNFKGWKGGKLYEEVRRLAPQAFLKTKEPL